MWHQWQSHVLTDGKRLSLLVIVGSGITCYKTSAEWHVFASQFCAYISLLKF
jgi:hypothetical protein